MLTAVGIVAEYNPFHNGHLYQLKEAKKKTGADVSVVVMSGNWTQRGDPAIYDKWVRTKLALLNSVDLVIELPFKFAVQPADIFARGAVNLLGNLQCTWLSFGVENAQFDFNEIVKNIKIDQRNSNFKNSHAQIIQENIFEQTGLKINHPNDILGLNYAKNNQLLDLPMKIVPIKRVGDSQHNDVKLSNDFSSATSIRNAIFDDNFSAAMQLIPNSDELINQSTVHWNKFWPYLRYQILESSITELNKIYQMSEGIEYRLKSVAQNVDSFDEFLAKVRNKRFNYSRIKRLCAYILVKANEQEMLDRQSYIRILGFNRLGQKYLNQIKKQVSLPIITKVNDPVIQKYLELDYRSGLLFKLIGTNDQDLYHSPIIIN
ncbi:nucleotidyltransferase [Lentilactobacillus laojiaonis]|uniref:nucleotidyltransferase n=1 Tax=Lentilactobacillus laojiaonis TaxID=2883998 RepID=UPI001D0A5488|nr:nucleotidyltransferase [Lentilactobacillus laojiaonis]UDM32598.1 nucleotidyltransferase [Lentilactobacillus laojiaonis]